MLDYSLCPGVAEIHGQVEAHSNNGILEIELQRLEVDRTKKIEIRLG